MPRAGVSVKEEVARFPVCGKLVGAGSGGYPKLVTEVREVGGWLRGLGRGG
jgi:hypothetical protein